MQCRSVGPPPLEAVASATKSYLVITKKDFSYVQLCTPHRPLIEGTLRVAAQKSVCPFPGASEESVQRPRTQAGLARFIQQRYSPTERCRHRTRRGFCPLCCEVSSALLVLRTLEGPMRSTVEEAESRTLKGHDRCHQSPRVVARCFRFVRCNVATCCPGPSSHFTIGRTRLMGWTRTLTPLILSSIPKRWPTALPLHSSSPGPA